MPADVLFGKVIGRFILAVADTIDDPDVLPDANPAEGIITFTSVAPNFRVGAPEPTTVVRTPIRCALDTDGRLIDPASQLGVWLVVGIYRVTYNLAGVNLESHLIEVTTTHTDAAPLDLTLAIPPTGSGLTITQYADLASQISILRNTVLTFPDAPVTSVNALTGDVVLTADEVGALTQAQADLLYAQLSASGGGFRGLWDSAVQYDIGDLTIINDILWGTTAPNVGVQPTQNVTINPAGGDGGPGNYGLDQMFGGAPEIIHPIRLTRAVLVGRISLVVQAGRSGLPALEVGLLAVRPTPSTPTPPTFITPPTTVPYQSGSGWHDIILDNPVMLQANTDYWISIKATGGSTADLNGQFGIDAWNFTAPMVSPTDRYVLARGTGGAWDVTDRHTFVQLGELIPQAWEAVADLSGPISAPVQSVNGLTGIVTLTASDVGAAALADVPSPEAIRDLVNAQFVAGANITIDVNDATDQVTISSSAAGSSASQTLRWRGIWSALQLLKAYNPAVDGTTGTVMTGIQASPQVTSISRSAALVQSGTLPGAATVYKVGVRGSGFTANNTAAQWTVTAPAGAAEVRFKHAFAAGPGGYGQAYVRVAGTQIRTAFEVDLTWAAFTRPLLPGDTLEVQTYSNANSVGENYVGDLEFWGAGSPYILGDLVWHQGAFYQCASAGTAETPGAGSAWTVLTSSGGGSSSSAITLVDGQGIIITEDSATQRTISAGKVTSTYNLQTAASSGASSTLGGYPTSNAFDGSDGTFWHATATTPALWWTFAVPRILRRIRVVRRIDYPSRYITSMTIDGTNAATPSDASTWTQVAAFSTLTDQDWTTNARVFDFANGVAYTSYRIKVLTAVNGTDATAIADIKSYTFSKTVAEYTAADLGALTQAQADLLYATLGSSGGSSAGTSVVVAPRTRVPNTGMIASSSSQYAASYNPENVFDELADTSWAAGGDAATFPQWIKAQYPAAHLVGTYSLRARLGANNAYLQMISAWTVQGSIDGTTWLDLDQRTGQTWADGQERSYSIATPRVYTFYRLYITANSGQAYTAVGEWSLYENPPIAVLANSWVKRINLPLTTLQDWTIGGGTWTVANGQIEQTLNSTLPKHFSLQSVELDLNETVIEVEVKAGNIGGLHQAGFYLSPGANLTQGFAVQFHRGDGGAGWQKVTFEGSEGVQSTGNALLATALDETVYRKLRARFNGDSLTIWVDGVLLGNFHGAGLAATGVKYVGLINYGCSAMYRNLKVWTPVGVEESSLASLNATRKIYGTQIDVLPSSVGMGQMIYLKKIVVPADGLLISIDAYIQGNGSQVGSLSAAVHSDNNGVPGLLRSTVAAPVNSAYLGAAGRWFSIPMGMWLTTGTYWLAVAALGESNGDMVMGYETGSGVHFATSGAWMSDGSGLTVVDSGVSWGIRASVL